MSSTATSTIASSVAAAVTATVTVDPPYPDWVDSTFSTLSQVNACILIATLIVMAVVGFNRMIAVPLLACVAGIFDNGFTWYIWAIKEYSLRARLGATVTADIFWGIQDAILPFYSFFMLERILKGKLRKVFMGLFAAMIVTILALRVGIFVTHIKSFTIVKPTTPEDIARRAYWDDATHHLTQGYFGVIAALECMSGTLLLRVFYSARRESLGVAGSNKGLFAQLAHSSEIRIVTLAFVGVTRAASFGWYDVRHSLDQVAYTLEQMFTVFLLVDLLLTRLAKVQAIADGRDFGYSNASPDRSADSGESGEADNSAAKKRAGGNVLGAANGKGPVDSVRDDYMRYVGKGWSRSGSAPVPVTVEVVEAVEVRGVGVLDSAPKEDIYMEKRL